jgi:hypothetical protein
MLAQVVGIPGLSKRGLTSDADGSTLLSKDEMTDHPLRIMVARRLTDVLDTPAVSKVLELKWTLFARARFMRRMVSFALYFALFCVVTLLRDRSQALRQYGDGWAGVVRPILEISLVIGAFMSLLHDWRARWVGRRSGRGGRFLEVSSALLILACAALFIAETAADTSLSEAIDTCAAAAALLMWLRLLHFCRAFSTVGQFASLLEHMGRRMLPFVAGLTLMVAAFGHAFYLLFRNNARGTMGDWRALLRVYQALLGNVTALTDEFEFAAQNWMAVLLFVAFTAAVVIGMLSLLVASMVDAMPAVKRQVYSDWLLERTTLILDVETELSAQQRSDPTLFPTVVHVLRPASALDTSDDSAAPRAPPAATVVSAAASAAADEEALKPLLTLTSKVDTLSQLIRAMQARDVKHRTAAARRAERHRERAEKRQTHGSLVHQRRAPAGAGAAEAGAAARQEERAAGGYDREVVEPGSALEDGAIPPSMAAALAAAAKPKKRMIPTIKKRIAARSAKGTL